MISLSHIIKIINEGREQLRTEFGVVEIGVFGSVVHGVQDADSDIDISAFVAAADRFGGPVRVSRRPVRLPPWARYQPRHEGKTPGDPRGGSRCRPAGRSRAAPDRRHAG